MQHGAAVAVHHSLCLSFNLCRGVGQLVLVLFGVSQRHEATTA
jgi:hypothetical protein